jgi:amino acid adenylation domain-containing protein
MVGDARGFIDPIFSSGVFLSMKSSFLVAPAIDAQLRGEVAPGRNPQLASAYAHITGAYDFVHRMIRMFYNPHAITWAAVGAEGPAHKAHESALAAGHYMLSGDFFENYEKYDKFFELLEEPKNFHRYRHLVIDRADFQRSDCETNFEQIFADMLDEDARRRRRAPLEAQGERLFDRVDLHAQKTPGAAAVEGSDAALSYAELASHSRAVAALLERHAIGRGDRVAVLGPKSPGQVACLYGILRAGAAYVPLGVDWPAERIAWIVGDVAPAAIIADREHAALLPAARPPVLWIEADGLPAGARAGEQPAAASPAGAADLAYILYTSGSTGRPKGVMHSHASALSFVRWAANAMGLEPSDRLASHAPFHFDLSVFDLYAASRAGAAVVLPDQDVCAMPARFAAWLGERRVTTVYSVPGVWVAALGAGAVSSAALPALRRIIYAGEPMAPKHVHALQQALPSVEVHNFYGPTETNVCTAYRVPRLEADRLPAAISIGTACSGDIVTVEDGELVARGGSLLLGYWGAPPRRPGEPYRTGDLVRFDEEQGGYVFVARRDGLRKVRGFRVELGEIEACLLCSPAVAEAVAAVDQRDPARAAVVAFVVPAAGASRDGMALRRHCARSLPSYMVPRVIWRDDLPRTATGKTDRAALEEGLHAVGALRVDETGRAPAEKRSGQA